MFVIKTGQRDTGGVSKPRNGRNLGLKPGGGHRFIKLENHQIIQSNWRGQAKKKKKSVEICPKGIEGEEVREVGSSEVNSLNAE